MRFREGDIVRIRKNSGYIVSIKNPRGWNGTIVEIISLDIIKVKWHNDKNNYNTYDEDDLRLVRRES